MKVRELLAVGCARFEDPATARLDAEILLGEVLGVNRAWLFANPEHQPQPDQEARFMELMQRRKKGEPVAHLTGRREFWSLSLKVSADVLIPRPETELLVETVLSFVPVDADWRIADLGTGSGAIALAIASERPRCQVHATDISPEALEIARENARANAGENGQINRPSRIQFHRGSWLEPLSGKFQVIVSNPPYIAPDDPHLLQGDCRFEPALALVAGEDGLEAIQWIASEAAQYLDTGGLLALEHGYDQGEKVRNLLRGLGYHNVITVRDLEKRERVTSGIVGAGGS